MIAFSYLAPGDDIYKELANGTLTWCSFCMKAFFYSIWKICVNLFQIFMFILFHECFIFLFNGFVFILFHRIIFITFERFVSILLDGFLGGHHLYMYFCVCVSVCLSVCLSVRDKMSVPPPSYVFKLNINCLYRT